MVCEIRGSLVRPSGRLTPPGRAPTIVSELATTRFGSAPRITETEGAGRAGRVDAMAAVDGHCFGVGGASAVCRDALAASRNAARATKENA